MQQLTQGTLVADRYRLERKLGAGGMGSVWLAQDQSLDSLCAVKLVDSDKVADNEVRVRFQREARAAARIRCANVVDVFDHGIWSGVPFIVMEYLEGEDLGTRIDREGTLSASAVYEIVVQVARGLVRAHAAGIVHRDLKPENIFLVPGDEHEIAKVLDFGIAKHDAYSITDKTTKTGSFLGTPYYVSPEQARGKPIDWRSDLWSFAIIVFQCLTGRPPFESEALGELMGLIIYEPIPKLSDRNPALSPALDAWWERAIQRDRELRFQSAREFADALADAIGIGRLAVPSIPPRSPLASGHDLDRESQPPIISVAAPASADASQRLLAAGRLLENEDAVSRGTPTPVSSTRRSLFPTLMKAGRLGALPRLYFALPRRKRAMLLGAGTAGLLGLIVLLVAGIWRTKPEPSALGGAEAEPAAAAAAVLPEPRGPAVTPAPEPSAIALESLKLEPPPRASNNAAEAGKPAPSADKPKPKPAHGAPRTPKPATPSAPDYGI